VKLLGLLTVAAMSGVTSAAEPAFSGNVGVTSNYIWRGETQTGDEAAVFGGLDYVSGGGAYAGLWTAPVSGAQEYELDLYGGYRFGRSGRWDIGFIRYLYPGEQPTGADRTGPLARGDFTELRIGVELGTHEVAWYYSPDYRATGEDQHYLEINLRRPFGRSTVEFHFGAKQGKAVDDTENRVGDYRLSLIRGPFTFSITEMTDNEDGRQSDNPRLAATWRHQIGLF